MGCQFDIRSFYIKPDGKQKTKIINNVDIERNKYRIDVRGIIREIARRIRESVLRLMGFVCCCILSVVWKLPSGYTQ